MSMCRVISGIFGRRCLLWPVNCLGKTLLTFALLHFVLQGHTCLLLQVSLDFLLCISIKKEKDIFFSCVSSRRSCRSSQNCPTSASLALVVGPRLELLWCWMVCLGNKPRSLWHLWNCTKVLHFGLFCWLWGLLHFFQGMLACSSIMVIWIKFAHSHPFSFTDS